MACRFPDADSPRELWENALSGRRAFRRIPDVRLNLGDYYDPDPTVPDRFHIRTAALIEGYEFDRAAYAVAGSTYRSTDLTHWLALDTAAQALADAGYPAAVGLPRERTAVVVGNSLTGEFTRANVMRLRWPYVRRTVAAALQAEGWDDDRVAAFLGGLEETYKQPFPAVNEDTLAGGLANTIAGRICNHFDLNGGGYTVDGACSSSLLSVATACRSLLDGDVDVALAGGVDLSIDPFELIGFAKTGALAGREMRVYDRASNGFWPGEGCGMVILMREPDAIADNRTIHATIAGFGISSDGKGGITRPEVSGYRLMLQRAYQSAGFGIDTVALFEGHGTGTRLGDQTELTALSQARSAAALGSAAAAPGVAAPGTAAIGTIKAMIGHTKAAAGVAGLIKTVSALRERVLPPTVGCVDPHDLLREQAGGLRALRQAEPWPDGAPLRAGVTAMGFGGINVHVVLEGHRPPTGPRWSARTRDLARSGQDVELILVDGGSWDDLRARLLAWAEWISTVSYAQLADAAATAQRRLRDLPYRAAVVVSSPQDAEHRLRALVESLDVGDTSVVTADGRSSLGQARSRARIGYLFPGQGSGTSTGGGALQRRFAEVRDLYAAAGLPTGGDLVATAIAQPRIVTGSMAGLRALSIFALEPVLAVGHSLGEITALHWAGAMNDAALQRVAANRGRIMAELSDSGTMAGLGADPETVRPLLTGLPVVIAGYNGPAQTVVAGPVEAIDEVRARAGAADVSCVRLRVSHAFHSPLVAPAAGEFRQTLAAEQFGPLGKRVISTVTGETLAADADLPALLHRQITEPVLFAQALQLAAKDVDLFVEVGPGSVLTTLAAANDLPVPAIALDTEDESLRGLLSVLGAAYVIGAPVLHQELFRDRVTKPLDLGTPFRFFANPCEQAPEIRLPAHSEPAGDDVQHRPTPTRAASNQPDADAGVLDVLRWMVAERAELPESLVQDDSHLLDDLHLSSITVSHLVNQAARHFGVAVTQTPTNVATATLAELAGLLDAVRDGAVADPPPDQVAGATGWARPYAIELAAVPLPPAGPAQSDGTWTSHSPANHELVETLCHTLEHGGVGGGVLVCLPVDCTEADVGTALKGAQAALAAGPGSRFVLVQQGAAGATGLAKTLRQEAPQLKVSVVRIADPEQAPAQVLAEVAATTGFTEAHYDQAGVRRVPSLRLLASRPQATTPLGPDDVLLVTGGGKGITAECARALALDSGARLAVLGRSDPEQDPELAANLRRLAESGVLTRYLRADVTDPEQVRQAVLAAVADLGPVTAVLHGAGRNEPAALARLDRPAFRETFAPKLDGLRAVLEAVPVAGLKLLVTFGSIIGRAGLAGEAHYATANEWLAAATGEIAATHPHCRVLCLEWSVWSGVGMGERLSVVESLTRTGITALTPEDGVRILRRLVADPQVPPVVVVSGRTGNLDTVRRPAAELPLWRFLERPLVHYPGVELITEAQLSIGSDPYLADHTLDGNCLFPAVFGLEAMTQVAAAAAGHRLPAILEDVEFERPVVLAPEGSTTIRIAAVVTDDTVQVVIRSSETGFGTDHFRARLRFSPVQPPPGPPEPTAEGLPAVPLHPATDLYAGLLFQGKRFQRLRRYHTAAARQVDAEVAALDATWFAHFLPADLLLGDPGTRDALMHGNQVCVPDATLLPTHVDRIHPGGDRLAAAGQLRYCATERYRDGDLYVYDLAVRAADSTVLERWEGLHLRAVRTGDGRGPWVPALLGPHLERTVTDLLGADLRVAVEPHPDDEHHRRYTSLAAGRALGRPVTVRYRPDGRPEVDTPPAGRSDVDTPLVGRSDVDTPLVGRSDVDTPPAEGPKMAGTTISAAHGPGFTLCVAGSGRIGCDVETVIARPRDVWAGLLASRTALAELLGAELGEDHDLACTRIWTAVEALQKAGAAADAPLTWQPPAPAGWAVLRSGDLKIATFATAVRAVGPPVVFAVLLETAP
jgi:enediyne polyketide synthase